MNKLTITAIMENVDIGDISIEDIKPFNFNGDKLLTYGAALIFQKYTSENRAQELIHEFKKSDVSPTGNNQRLFRSIAKLTGILAIDLLANRPIDNDVVILAILRKEDKKYHNLITKLCFILRDARG